VATAVALTITGIHAHPPTATGLNTWKVGFWVFIGSETLFFGTLISTYMVYKGQSVVGPFPREILDIPLTTVSTFVLLMSSLAVVLALEFLQQGRATWRCSGR
jgi:heme/copper-type cytochrome/quinol oxidase subunit 3